MKCLYLHEQIHLDKGHSHMDKKIENLINSFLGKKCSRQQVGNCNSLSLGFGQKKYHNDQRLITDFYCEWEIGTYYRSWRIFDKNTLFYGGNDVNDFDDSNVILNQIDFGSVVSLKNQPTDFDVRVHFDSGISIDFLTTIRDDDEIFHIFCPNDSYIAFTVGKGWEVLDS